MTLRTFIDRPILSGVLSVLVVLLGVIGLVQLPVEQFPEIAPPTVRVSATVTVYFRAGTDADVAAMNVQNRIAQAQGLLPAEVIRSGISVRKSQNSTAKIVALYSPDDRYDQKLLYNYFKIHVEPQLARIQGVGDITVFGSDYSLRIWLKTDRMAAYGLVSADIAAVLDEQNIEAPTGTLGADADNAFQYVLKYRGRYESEEEFGDLVLRSTSDGGILRLRDVADIELGSLSYAVRNELSGHPGANCMIAQTPGSNADEVVKAVDAVIREAAEELPAGMELVDLMSIKSFLDASIRNVLETLVEAMLLVVLVVWLFLQNLRATVIPATAIVVSLVGTFAFLYFAGFSINMLTLFALVLVIRTVVDDAIVVVKAVQARFDAGCTSSRTAAVDAMQSVGHALVTTSLVFMAVFVPVCFIGGATGKFYTQFGATMAAAVCISTFNALTLSPALCMLLMRPNGEGFLARFRSVFDTAFGRIVGKYRNVLFFCFRRRWLVGVLLPLAAALFFYLLSTTKTGLVPDEDTGTVVVDVQAAPGEPCLDGTDLGRYRALHRRHPAVPGLLQIHRHGYAGGTGCLERHVHHPTQAVERTHRTQRRQQIRYRRNLPPSGRCQQCPHHGLRLAHYRRLRRNERFRSTVQNRRSGSVEELQRHAQTFIAALNERPEIARAQTSFDTRYPQYRVKVDAALCKRHGISPAEVLDAVGGYIGGSYSSNINRFSKLYRVMLQAAPEYRLDTRSFDRIYVRTPSGEMSLVSQYIILTRVYGAEALSRFNLFPSIAVNGAPAAGYSSGQAIAAIREVAAETAGIVSAALSAAGARLCPILMTSLTMIFGLLPMIFSSGIGSNGSRSLAVGTIGGMIVGTFALLLVVPVLFSVCQTIQEIFGRNNI